MARPIVLSNGELHVGVNNYGLVHDFYFPYVGLENHSAGKDLRHHVGVWIDGTISWLDNNADQWQMSFSYPDHTLIGHIVAKNNNLGVQLEFDDVVVADVNLFMRSIVVTNLHDHEQEVRLFTHQAFAIGDSRSNTDTAQYLPDSNAILHYHGRRAFVVSGRHDTQPFDQYTVGLFGIEGREGTFRDADDGELSFGNVEHGRVDSTLRFRLSLGAGESQSIEYWIAAGTSVREALQTHKTAQDQGTAKLTKSTALWWKTWMKPAQKVSQNIAPDYQDQFLKSIMLIKSQIDKRGAVIASTDSTMLNVSRDAYAYCWPRDGSLVLWPLIRIGYTEEPLRFFEFCRRNLHAEGYLMHKYRADGALGASWHPYVHDGVIAPPIQEDETALTLFMFSQYYNLHTDPSLLKDFYTELVTPMADFLASYIDNTTGLPKPSYDLWEERFLTTTFSTAATYAALLAAAELADDAADPDSAVRWRSAAEDIQHAAHKHLFNTSRQAFYKGIIVKNDEIIHDETIDVSSAYGAFMFGLFKADGAEVSSAFSTIVATFTSSDNQFGLPRYENDSYYRQSNDVNGNWWFITSLWRAQYAIDQGDQATAQATLQWVNSLALSTGVLSEQINPITGTILSVAPLTWSHAEYASTVLDTLNETDR